MPELDVASLSLDEIKKLANEEIEIQTAAARDEKGRFIKKTDVPVVEETEVTEPIVPKAAPAPTPQRLEIDLGEGSGKQVFEGKDWEEVSRKLATAQENASRKIREQAEQLRTLETKKAQDAQQVDADQEFVYSQELMSKPTVAFQKMFKQMTGLEISEFKSVADRTKVFETAQNQQRETQLQEAASTAFMEAHPEYIPNERNGARLVKSIKLLIHEAWVAKQKIDYGDLLLKAYLDLSESGLLELQDPEHVTAEEPTIDSAKPRIGEVDEVVQQQRSPKRVSSLMNRGRAVTPPKTTEPTEEDLQKMPLDKLRELANAQLAKQRAN